MYLQKKEHGGVYRRGETPSAVFVLSFSKKRQNETLWLANGEGVRRAVSKAEEILVINARREKKVESLTEGLGFSLRRMMVVPFLCVLGSFLLIGNFTLTEQHSVQRGAIAP